MNVIALQLSDECPCIKSKSKVRFHVVFTCDSSFHAVFDDGQKNENEKEFRKKAQHDVGRLD